MKSFLFVWLLGNKVFCQGWVEKIRWVWVHKGCDDILVRVNFLKKLQKCM